MGSQGEVLDSYNLFALIADYIARDRQLAAGGLFPRQGDY